MTQLKDIGQGAQEVGSGLQATGMEALLDQLSMPAPWDGQEAAGRAQRRAEDPPPEAAGRAQRTGERCGRWGETRSAEAQRLPGRAPPEP